MPGLELSKYRLVLQPLEPLSLPAYKGSTFRGGFGHVFRRVACACGGDASVHQRGCLYAQVFETTQDDALPELPRTVQIPHPFVLEPPPEAQRVYMPGERLSVHIILIGRAVEWLPYFIFTFDELGRVGVGQNRGRYRMEEVVNLKEASATTVFSGKTRRFLGPGQRVTFEELWEPTALVETAEVEFLTYARVMGRGDFPTALDFPLLFGALLRRMALLQYIHCGGGRFPLPTGHAIEAVAVLKYFYDRAAQEPEARTAIREAFGVAAQVAIALNGLRGENWERYSGRQGVRMNLGGVLGKVRYRGPVGSFLPYLRLGEYIHVGKNTTFGLGQMVVRV